MVPGSKAPSHLGGFQSRTMSEERDAKTFAEAIMEDSSLRNIQEVFESLYYEGTADDLVRAAKLRAGAHIASLTGEAEATLAEAATLAPELAAQAFEGGVPASYVDPRSDPYNPDNNLTDAERLYNVKMRGVRAR